MNHLNATSEFNNHNIIMYKLKKKKITILKLAKITMNHVIQLLVFWWFKVTIKLWSNNKWSIFNCAHSVPKILILITFAIIYVNLRLLFK